MALISNTRKINSFTGMPSCVEAVYKAAPTRYSSRAQPWAAAPTTPVAQASRALGFLPPSNSPAAQRESEGLIQPGDGLSCCPSSHHMQPATSVQRHMPGAANC